MNPRPISGTLDAVPVYFVTLHAYRSWSEGNRLGYVQHGEGLRASNPRLAAWRRVRAAQPPARFGAEGRRLLLGLVAEVAVAVEMAAHGASVTPTHVHAVVSFSEPSCPCPASAFCGKTCPAWRAARGFGDRLKRVAATAMNRLDATPGRRCFSRGGDYERVRDRFHFDRITRSYLQKHVAEGGDVWVPGGAAG